MSNLPRLRKKLPSSESATEVHLRYIERDVDTALRRTNDLNRRVTTLEKKASFAEKVGRSLKTASQITWQIWAMIILMILGLTGHITAEDVKTYIAALKQ